jgi:hypothetical protein
MRNSGRYWNLQNSSRQRCFAPSVAPCSAWLTCRPRWLWMKTLN